MDNWTCGTENTFLWCNPTLEASQILENIEDIFSRYLYKIMNHKQSVIYATLMPSIKRVHKQIKK